MESKAKAKEMFVIGKGRKKTKQRKGQNAESWTAIRRSMRSRARVITFGGSLILDPDP